MATKKIICILYIYLTVASGQVLRQYRNKTLQNQGICKSKVFTTLRGFYGYYKDCIVVLGNLKVAIIEKTTTKDFKGISFPNLREVTEFVVFYRVNNTVSLGHLFPNLARIRGEKLFNNYALIIHDMSKLEEIGLYGLLKIDRGGVVIWGVPKACFITTVDWETIAPRSWRSISSEDKMARCNFPCSCSLNSTINHCWSNRKCQIYLEDPEADKCHDQCLGCRKTVSISDECSLCRHFTHNGKCLASCPPNTIILPDSQYCITNEECLNLNGWVWNNKCVFHCPVGYKEIRSAIGTTCKLCPNCTETCQNLNIYSISSAQEAARCVYVNGSLKIHIRPVPDIDSVLKTYLGRIQEVSDYIFIYDSETITSLDFLSSLSKIKGKKLKNDTYSLIITKMANLQTLFVPSVTENLKIDRGTLKMYNNPNLCVSQIEKIRSRFLVQPNKTDVPLGMNGYSGSCEEDSVAFQVRVINETSAVIMFSSLADPDAHYTVLYARLPPGADQNLVPETCSESEWYAVNLEVSFGHQLGILELASLHPASTYAICVETYDPIHRKLARSAIANFTTFVGKPEPPFIRKLIASNSTAVHIHWVDHKDYIPYITHYELDVSLLEIKENYIAVKDQCKHFQITEVDINPHVVEMRIPPGYARGCESLCESSVSARTGVVEDFFDVCRIIGCDNLEEDEVPGNTTFRKYAKTLVMTFKTPRSNINIDGLAPFRDYRFRLRACADNKCSRSSRGVVRTLASKAADVPSAFRVNANEHGHISVKWIPPELTNGPILSFTIEVLPMVVEPKNLLPQTWCVLANETSYTLKYVKAMTYSVRVCTRSMASESACTEWKTVEVVVSTPTWWWTSVIFAICLYIGSIAAGFVKKTQTDSNDLLPIVSSSVESGTDSEPPSRMFSDFAPVYSIPLRDTRL